MKGEAVCASVQHSVSVEEAASPRFVVWVQVLWQRIVRISRHKPRRLRLCESLPLGERRFVAVVEFERSRFLVGGTSASLVLLAKLESTPEDVSDVAIDEEIEGSAEERR